MPVSYDRSYGCLVHLGPMTSELLLSGVLQGGCIGPSSFLTVTLKPLLDH